MIVAMKLSTHGETDCGLGLPIPVPVAGRDIAVCAPDARSGVGHAMFAHG